MTTTETTCAGRIGRRAFLAATTAGSVGAAALTLGPAAAEAPAPQVEPVDLASLPRVRQTLVPPPGVPAHEQVATGGPKIIEVDMTIVEKKMQIDEDGASIWVFAYDGSVPGPLIVCHQGDYVELTLRSAAENQMEHNIDFHAATGAMGGGELTKILPGEKVVLRWRALKAGTFVYHCAPGGEMTPFHVLHGMNGAVMVLPRDGLRDGAGNRLTYDRAYYIGEQDYYLARNEDGTWKDYETSLDDFTDAMDVMRTLTPTHVVFNGARGALTGDKALTAKVGERVLFIHAQANRDSRPHIIGGHGDHVWETGSFRDAPATDLETWFIRGGSAGAALYTFVQPGLYAYVTHNLIEAVLLGAVAHINVEGTWDNDVMELVEAPAIM